MQIVPLETIQNRILIIRGVKVILDSDLAQLYGTTTKRLNEQVRRNLTRFPHDFTFQLTVKEAEDMRSQFATASKRNERFRSFAFTEHGALMAATVLKTSIAAKVSVYIVRAFIELRERAETHKDVLQKLNQLEYVVGAHDEKIRILFKTIRGMMRHSKNAGRVIGFRS